MSRSALFAIDLVSISVLVFGLYFPRHRRRDMIVAFLGVNVGVLAVVYALSSATVGSGLGLGLFGVLSIIRLRSTELDQGEIAYYFASLAIGLLCGFVLTPVWLTPVLIGALLGVLLVADHPKLLPNYRTQDVMLDRAFTNEVELISYLEKLLGARVHQVNVRRVDLVRDTTQVQVRFEVGASVPVERSLI